MDDQGLFSLYSISGGFVNAAKELEAFRSHHDAHYSLICPPNAMSLLGLLFPKEGVQLFQYLLL